MASISFEYDAAEFEKALEKAAKQFPASSEKVLKTEAKSIATNLKSRVNSEAKGHHYTGRGSNTKPKPLARSFHPGKVIHSGKKVTVAVTTTAPHYHLYEEGHAMITHKKKNKKGRTTAGGLRQVGQVRGMKTVAKYMAQRSDYSELIAQGLLDDILREAGLDT